MSTSSTLINKTNKLTKCPIFDNTVDNSPNCPAASGTNSNQIKRKIVDENKNKQTLPKKKAKRQDKENCKNRSDAEILKYQLEKLGPSLLKQCMCCEKNKHVSQFDGARREPLGIVSQCKTCRSARHLKKKKGEDTTTTRQKHQREEKEKHPNEKKCCTCHMWKQFLEFAKNPQTGDGYRTECAECGRKSDEKRAAKFGALKTKIKRGSGCQQCGETTLAALDFAHYDAEQKHKSSSGKTVSPGCLNSIKGFTSELKNMRVLCANCHRVETRRQQIKNLSTNSDAVRHQIGRAERGQVVLDEK